MTRVRQVAAVGQIQDKDRRFFLIYFNSLKEISRFFMDVLDDVWTIRLVKSVGQIEVGKRRVNFRQLRNIAGNVCIGTRQGKKGANFAE